VVLIVVAVGLLVGGVIDGSNPLIVGSMAATVLSAIVLVIGVRQSADDDADTPPGDNTPTQVFPSPFRDLGRATRWDRMRRGGTVAAGTATDAAPPASEQRSNAGDAVRVPTARTAEAGTSSTGPNVGSNQGAPDPDPAVDSRLSGVEQTGAAAADRTAEGALDDYEDDEYDEVPADEPAVESVSEQDAARVRELRRDVHVIDGRPRYHLAGCVHLMGRQSEPLPISEARELGFEPCALCEPDRTLLAESSQGASD
jgi:hypothetical protein